MKKWIFIIVIFILSANYCFAKDNIYEITQKKSTTDQTQISKLQEFTNFSYKGSTLTTSITENESSFQESTQFQFSNFKNNPNNFSNFLKISEGIYSSTFSQYSAAFNNILIKRRKVDIIFPFHYFW
jgi:hypothetical protein